MHVIMKYRLFSNVWCCSAVNDKCVARTPSLYSNENSWSHQSSVLLPHDTVCHVCTMCCPFTLQSRCFSSRCSVLISKPSTSKEVILHPDRSTIKQNYVVSKIGHSVVQTGSFCLYYTQMKASRHWRPWSAFWVFRCVQTAKLWFPLHKDWSSVMFFFGSVFFTFNMLKLTSVLWQPLKGLADHGTDKVS